MISPELAKLLDRLVFTERILWFALTFAIVIYGGAVYFVSMSTQPEPASSVAWLREIFAALSVAAAGIALWFRRRGSSGESIRQTAAQPVDPTAMATDQTGKVNATRLAALERLSTRDRRLLRIGEAHVTTTIVSLALHESIALYGFVLAFLRHDFGEYLPFGAAALIVNLFNFPGPVPLPENAEHVVDMLGE